MTEGKQQSQTARLLIKHIAVHIENDLQAKVKGSYQTVAWADMSAWLMLSLWVILVQYLGENRIERNYQIIPSAANTAVLNTQSVWGFSL